MSQKIIVFFISFNKVLIFKIYDLNEKEYINILEKTVSQKSKSVMPYKTDFFSFKKELYELKRFLMLQKEKEFYNVRSIFMTPVITIRVIASRKYKFVKKNKSNELSQP